MQEDSGLLGWWMHTTSTWRKWRAPTSSRSVFMAMLECHGKWPLLGMAMLFSALQLCQRPPTKRPLCACSFFARATCGTLGRGTMRRSTQGFPLESVSWICVCVCPFWGSSGLLTCSLFCYRYLMHTGFEKDLTTQVSLTGNPKLSDNFWTRHSLKPRPRFALGSPFWFRGSGHRATTNWRGWIAVSILGAIWARSRQSKTGRAVEDAVADCRCQGCPLQRKKSWTQIPNVSSLGVQKSDGMVWILLEQT